MRACFWVATALVWSLSTLAVAATVTLNQPTQGATAASSTVGVAVSTSEDFAAGRDGLVEIWVDGKRATTLKGTSGRLSLSPGDHLIQARLVDLNHQALRVPATSEQVTVTVPTIDPHSP